MRFPRQECWSGLPFPSPGNPHDPGIDHVSCSVGGFFITEPAGKPVTILITIFTIVPKSFSQDEGTLSHFLLGESWVLLE